MKQSPDNLSRPAPLSYTDELKRHTNQLWLGIWIANILVLLSTFFLRRLSGTIPSPLSISIQIILNGLVIVNILLLKTKFARLAQGIYVFAIHLVVPVVLLLYGGTRGFGDIALYVAILLTLLYGWQMWMFLTYGLMGGTLLWVLYRDSTGDPIVPLLDYSAQFAALKFLVVGFIMLFAMRYISTFYRALLDTYRVFAEEQVQLNEKLKASEQALAASNKSLMLSRQKIVSAREEERRRLRRDLHDGLGPTLAAQLFRLTVAQEMVNKKPDKASAILVDVESDIRGTLSDVRELVYGLRPPLLDQLGLLGVIADIAKQQQGRVDIHLELPAELPNISAAVEVALFRIVQTSIDNVVKHAQASCCNLRLAVTDQSIMLTVADDGVGMGDGQPGVGITSMHERAEELGGAVCILPVLPHGTKLQVTIPLS